MLAMDKSNLEALKRMSPPQFANRIQLFMNYAKNFDDEEVPTRITALGMDLIW